MPHADTPLRRLMVAVDVHRYSSLDPLGQVDAQQALADALSRAAEAVGLHRSLWRTQPQGDAELAVLPPETDEAAVVADFPRELATSLYRQNRSRKAEHRLRLRVAMHCGVLHLGALGYPGPAPIETCRLLDAPPLKQALAEAADADVALIVSAQLFGDIVAPGYRGLRPHWFRKVPVTVKEYSGNGYVTLPGLGPPSAGDPPPDSPTVSPAPDAPRPGGTYTLKIRAVTTAPSSTAIGRDQHIHNYGSGSGRL